MSLVFIFDIFSSEEKSDELDLQKKLMLKKMLNQATHANLIKIDPNIKTKKDSSQLEVSVVEDTKSKETDKGSKTKNKNSKTKRESNQNSSEPNALQGSVLEQAKIVLPDSKNKNQEVEEKRPVKTLKEVFQSTHSKLTSKSDNHRSLKSIREDKQKSKELNTLQAPVIKDAKIIFPIPNAGLEESNRGRNNTNDLVKEKLKKLFDIFRLYPDEKTLKKETEKEFRPNQYPDLTKAPESYRKLGYIKSMISKLTHTSPFMVASRIQTNISRQQYQQIKSDFLPKVTLQGRYSRSYERLPGNLSTLYERDLGFQATQPIVNPALIYQKRVGHMNVKESKLRQKEQVQQILSEYLRLYMNLYRLDKVVDLAKLNKGVNRDNYWVTKERFEEGELTITDMEQSKTRDHIASTVLLNARHEVHLAKLRYIEITGESPPDKLPLIDFNINHEKVNAILSSNSIQFHPSLKRLKLNSNKQSMQIKAVGHTRLPSVSLVSAGKFLKESGDLSQGKDREYSLALELNYSLFDGQKIKSRVREERYKSNVIQQQIELLERQLKHRIQKSWQTVRLQEKMQVEYGKAAASAKKMVAGFQEEYLSGTRTSTDVLDAENERFVVETHQINSKIEMTLSKLDLLTSFGLVKPEIIYEILLFVPEKK